MPARKKDKSNKIKRPSLFWLATEAQRAIVEFGTFLPYQFIKQRKLRGDGHPILVLPGFMASDTSTYPLRRFLNKSGYKAYEWGIGRNFGNNDYLEKLIERVEYLYLTHRRTVSLIGWSVGGVFAREIAKIKPKLVRQVIAIGSPFGGLMESNYASWIFSILKSGRGTEEEFGQQVMENLIIPPKVPTSAIYSKRDGIVPWEVCREVLETDIHQNIEVQGSHLGYGVNPQVINVIADRLMYSADNWKKFQG